MEPQNNNQKPAVPGGMPDMVPDASKFFQSKVEPHLREMSQQPPPKTPKQRIFNKKLLIVVASAMVFIVVMSVLAIYAAGKSKTQYTSMNTLSVPADTANHNAAYSVDYPRQFTEISKDGAARTYGLLDDKKRVLGALVVTPQYLGEKLLAATAQPTLTGLKAKGPVYDSLESQLALNLGAVKVGDFKEFTTASGQKGVQGSFTYALKDGTPMYGVYELIPGAAHFYVLKVLVRQDSLASNQAAVNKMLSGFNVDVAPSP